MLYSTNKTTHVLNSFPSNVHYFSDLQDTGKRSGTWSEKEVLHNTAPLQGKFQHLISSQQLPSLPLQCCEFLSVWSVSYSLSVSSCACMSLWFSAAIAKSLLISFGYNLLFYFSLAVFSQSQKKPKLGKAGLVSLFSNLPEGKSWYQSHKKRTPFSPFF